jgi:hypothetical protein
LKDDLADKFIADPKKHNEPKVTVEFISSKIGNKDITPRAAGESIIAGLDKWVKEKDIFNDKNNKCVVQNKAMNVLWHSKQIFLLEAQYQALILIAGKKTSPWYTVPEKESTKFGVGGLKNGMRLITITGKTEEGVRAVAEILGKFY